MQKEAEGAAQAKAADKLSVLTCLAHIARRMGIEASVDTLMRRFGSIPDLLTPDLTASIAAGIGLEAKPLKVRWRDLPRLRRLLPAIMPLNDGTAVILDAVEEHPTAGLTATLITPSATGDSRILVDERQLR